MIRKINFYTIIGAAFFIACSVLVPAPLFSADPVRIDSTSLNGQYIGKNVEYLHDVERNLTIDDILKKNISSRFMESGREVLAFPNEKKPVYWLRFTIKNSSDSNIEWFLEIGNIYIDSLKLFQPTESGKDYTVRKAGAHLPFNVREIGHRFHIFRITSKPGPGIFYIRIDNSRTGFALNVPLRTWSQGKLFDHVIFDSLVNGIIYGLAFLLFLFNLIFYISIRDRNYLYLSLAILLGSMYSLCYDGFAFQYLWGNTPWMNYSIYFFLLLNTVVSILFFRSFVRSDLVTPRLDKIFVALSIFFGISAPVMFPGVLPSWLLNWLGLYFYSPLNAIYFFLSIFSAIIAIRKGSREAKIFLFAVFVFIFAGYIGSLAYLGIMQTSFLTFYGTKISAYLIAVLLTLALADQIKTLKGKTDNLNLDLGRESEKYNQTSKELLEERERLSVTLSSIGDGVIATDNSSNITLMNETAGELTGWNSDDAIGKPLIEVLNILDPKSREPLSNPVKVVLQAEEVLKSLENYILVSKNGDEYIIAESCAPIRDRDSGIVGVVMVIRDITEKVRMREELNKVDKLNSIGILAGSIAHDFNNILTAIMGSVSLAKKIASKNGSDPRMADLLDHAEKATEQASGLTRQFLTFARGGAPVKQVSSARELIYDAAKFVQRGSNASISFTFSEDLRPVLVDRDQFYQVIQNLVINSTQAMPDGGSITISADNIIVTQEMGLQMKNGDYIKIVIADDGIGIPPEDILKIFEPFFTTKKSGSGLGMASAYSIVKNHRGDIVVESEVGRGTSCSIYLPATAEKVEFQREKRVKFRKYKGRILLMDDDESVAGIGKKLLEELGCEVVVASEGTEALELYRESINNGARFDLVILDLIIPGGMGGRRTIEQLLEIDPDAIAIVSSGYSNDPIMAKFGTFGFSGVLSKPFSIRDILGILNSFLSSGPLEGTPSGD